MNDVILGSTNSTCLKVFLVLTTNARHLWEMSSRLVRENQMMKAPYIHLLDCQAKFKMDAPDLHPKLEQITSLLPTPER